MKIYLSKKPDLIHQTYYSNPKVKLKPTVLTAYDLIHEKFQSDFKVEFPKRTFLLSADHIIFISQNTKKDLMDIYNIDEKNFSHLSCFRDCYKTVSIQKIFTLCWKSKKI